MASVGSAITSLTSAIAARWKITSAPLTASVSPPVSSTSTGTHSASARCGGFGSSTRTTQSASSRASTTCVPMNPDPPVTATVLATGVLCSGISPAAEDRPQGNDDMFCLFLAENRRDRQADVVRAELLGSRQGAVDPRLEHRLLVQRKLVDLARQADAVLGAQGLLELGPIDAFGKECDVLVVVAAGVGRDGQRGERQVAQALVVDLRHELAVGDELVEAGELAHGDGRVRLAHPPVVTEVRVHIRGEAGLALIAERTCFVGEVIVVGEDDAAL